MTRKKLFLYGGIAAAIIAAIIIYRVTRSKETVDQRVKAQRGVFEIVVATTGDLQAQNMERIDAPEEIRGRNIRLNEIKILDMVAEGTVVDSGDYVAMLDRSGADNTIKSALDELDQLRNQYENTLLDTSLNLQNIRDNIISLEFAMEEAEITVEQSIYEPPATQRQAKNNYDKAKRNYEQEIKKYALRREQEMGKVRDVQLKVERKEKEYSDLMDVLGKFTITAPKSGMVIYLKEWSGEKRKVGSSISPWDRTVATLPDLSVMMSKTYVNEIDISKIKKNQKVRIGVDAFPEKQYTGVVTEVANVGEQLRNADAKVFEVVIRVNESDPILRPSMTTSNQIITSVLEDVVYVPLEALHGNDSITFVYRTNGTKQVVVTGDMNDNFRVIEQGLNEGDEVYLSTPENVEKFKLTGEDLIPIIKERAEQKLMEEERVRQENERRESQRRSRRSGGGQGRGARSGSTVDVSGSAPVTGLTKDSKPAASKTDTAKKNVTTTTKTDKK